MMFLDPKSDMVFKRLFGSIAHKNIVISFLNSVLERTSNVNGGLVVDVVINDPSNVPESEESKASAVDIRCTDQAGNQYIIEMQVIRQSDYAARAQYYSALGLSRQLGIGEQYNKLVPVIFVGILDFRIFDGNDYLSHHLTLNTKTHAHELKHQIYHFIELDKFEKNIDNLTTILDKWTYFFKYAATLQKKPDSFKEPVLEEAFNALAQGSWSKSELEAYDRYLDASRSRASQLETATIDGEVRGEARGEARGKAQVAINLLQAGFDSETVAKMAELSIDEIKKLEKFKKINS